MTTSPLPTSPNTLSSMGQSDWRADAAPMCLVSVDGAGQIVHVGPQFDALLGRAGASVVGSPIGELCKDPAPGELTETIEAVMADQSAAPAGRHWFTAEHRADLLIDVFADASAGLHDVDAGSLVQLVLRDVTAAYVEEQKREGFGDELQEAFGAVEMAVTRWTPTLELEYHSPEFEPLVMASADLLVDKPSLDELGFTPDAARSWAHEIATVVLDAQPREFDWETDDDRQIHSRAIAELAADGSVATVLVVSHDVTEERARYEELTRRALYDPLTGLANRATAHAYIDRSLERRGRTGTSEAAIFLDLDRFKATNDSLGHAAGDELLVTVAKRLSATVRPHDVVSRLGGDEFVIYLEQMEGIDAVLVVVDRIRAAIAEPIAIAGRELRVRASLGVAFAADRDETAEALIAKADAAMYKAKSSGRDCVELYDEALRARAEQRMKNEQALRRAMSRGEMEVHFLPEFDLKSRRVVGAEALLRWQHPKRGLIPAAEFIGLAEETGLLINLGNEVLRRSCELVAGWLRNRSLEDFTLRVNISPRQLMQPTLVHLVSEALEASKLDPSVLCLELAEATLTSSVVENVKQLERLRDLGVKISVDDFGTAASSLTMLKQLPVDMLKIDMSFVRGLGIDPRDDAIVEAIIRLGHALDMQVVAEGIDSTEQIEDLIAFGCQRGQGYGLSRVLRPNEFLRRWM